MFKAILGNKERPEYGEATIPFPIPQREYDSCIELLDALEIGGADRHNCTVEEIEGGPPILARLIDSTVNVDDLDYLAKRLDSFTDRETAKFQSMAVKLGVSDLRDFINLTFCCQQAKVITDFSDLEAIGRDRYMTCNGGTYPMEDLKYLNDWRVALDLISNHAGTVTPYGVVYDNGMELEQLYDGKHLPGYHYEEDMLAVGISSVQEPEDTAKITWLYLPCTRLQIERGLQRTGIADPEDMRFWYEDSSLPQAVEDALEYKQESLFALNDLAAAIKKLSMAERGKLSAAVSMVEPVCASQIRQLAENLDLFDFAPDARTPAEYGRYMIQASGHFEYDENLEDFYDYEKYGQQRIEQERGTFTEQGYIAYHGTLSMDQLMMEDPCEAYRQEQGFQMGGL